jgi:hypothetical protein
MLHQKEQDKLADKILFERIELGNSAEEAAILTKKEQLMANRRAIEK